MIMALLVLKTRCKEFYEKNYRVVRSVLKIVISLILYSIILYQLPFSKELREYGLPLSVILALVSGFVPDSVIIFFAAMLTVFEISSVSYLVAACFLFVLLIYFLLFGRYAKSQSYLVLLIPALWPLNVVLVVPIVAALFLNLAMIPACLAGVFIRYILLAVENLLYNFAKFGRYRKYAGRAAVLYSVSYPEQGNTFVYDHICDCLCSCIFDSPQTF